MSYRRVSTIAHIKKADILGTDPITGNIIIEAHGGPQDSEDLRRIGAFSIARGALIELVRQAHDELSEDEETIPPAKN